MTVYAYSKANACFLFVIIMIIFSGAAFASNVDPIDMGSTDTATSSYELGQGYKLGNSGFTLGGYTSLQYQDLQNQSANNPNTSLSHLSMFVWWENESRLRFFSEIDNQSLLSADDQSEDNGVHFLSIERLYFDYTLNDFITLRAGKYLTPIGRWNQIHADPLVWTTSRPLITENLFPEHITGVMALGTVPIFGMQADYTVYSSIGTDIRPDPAEGQYNEAYGARLNLPVNANLQMGLSYSSFEVTPSPGANEQLLGMDFVWASHGTEISAEGAIRFSSLGSQYNVKGGFLQGVTPIYEKLFLVGRIESMSNPPNQNATKLGVVGVNFRYSRAVSLKAEFIHGINQNINDSGMLTSISVLF